MSKANTDNSAELRVLFLTRKHPPSVGGMERASYGLIESLRRKLRAEVIAWGGSQAWLPLFMPYCLIAACLRILRHRPDVIHLGDAVMSLVGETLRKWFRVPVVATVHGLDLTHPNPLYQWMARRGLRACDRIICVSRATAEACRALGFSERLVVIPNGIDPRTMPVADEAARQLVAQALPATETPMLLSVARLVRRKGIANFIREILPQIVADRPDVVYWVVGEGPEGPAIRQAVAATTLADHVRLWGRVSDELLGAIYERASLFLMPNIQVPGDMEGFGVVVLEANLAGVPVVGSDLEGLRDSLTEGENGLLVPPGDTTGFARRVLDLLADEQARRGLAERAREHVRSQFGWDAVAQSYEEVFAELLQAAAAPVAPQATRHLEH